MNVLAWPPEVLHSVELLGVTARSMAHVIRKLEPVLLYDCRRVLDTTPGQGAFWSQAEPVPWSIVSSIHDFRRLPFPDRAFDLTMYDPPHTAAAGEGSYFKARYGTYKAAEIRAVMMQGARECWRVSDIALVAKCTDHVNAARFQRQTGWIIDAIGQEPFQTIHVVHNPVGSRRWSGFLAGPEGPTGPAHSARSVASTLLVFRRGSQEHSAPARIRRLSMV